MTSNWRYLVLGLRLSVPFYCPALGSFPSLYCKPTYIRSGPYSCRMGNLENLMTGRVAFWVSFSIIR